MQKIEREKTELKPISGFTFIGDPGCDGLGVEIMSVFNAVCREAAGDFLLIGGDIVPEGKSTFYQNVVDMVDSTASKPSYMLAGNHDTLDYETYFGKKNYFLYEPRLLLVVLDNSRRAFSQETLDLLKRSLEYARDNIIIAFHIPPPNAVTRNSVSTEEWAKVRDILEPVIDKVKYVLCGHVHSYFEDNVDGIRMVASGGGGARMEEVDGVPMPYYHSVEFSFDSAGNLGHAFKPLSRSGVSPIAPEVSASLHNAYAGECMAFVRYRLYGEDALKNGNPGLAKLFFAAADSEFHHARNFFYAMNGFKPCTEAIAESIEKEAEEVNTTYVEGLNLSKRHGAGLAAYAFDDARKAEVVHLRLFSEAEKALGEGASDIPEKQYLTCTSCGYTASGLTSDPRCPVCGAPHDKFRHVSA